MSKTIEIVRTPFDYEYFNSVKRFNGYTNEKYLTHNAVIFNRLEIGNKTLYCQYEDSQGYYHNDYSVPLDSAGLSEYSDCIVIEIDSLYEADFDDKLCDEYISELIEKLDCDVVKTKDDLFQLYVAIQENNLYAKRFYEDLFDENFKFKIIEEGIDY